MKNISEFRRSPLEEKISILLLYLSVFIPILTGMPFVPSAVKYAADVLWLGLVLCALLKKRIVVRKNIKTLILLAAGLFGYALIVYLIRYQSIFYFIWGFRNLFRFYIAFFAFADRMNEDTVERWFSLIDIIFWINLVLTGFQFVFMGVRQDYLGGVFGTTSHTNGYTLPLLCIVVVRHLCRAFEGDETLWKGMLYCVMSLLIAAMAELKFFFVVFLLVLIAAAIITKFSVKKLIWVILGCLAAIIGAQLLVSWFGFEDFLTLEGIIEQATRGSYANSTAGDINRLSAIPALNQRILDTPLERLFGLGLGNCDTSNVAIFNTPFSVTYSYLHYTWFTAPMIYLEMGYIGMTVYLLFFVACLWLSLKAFSRKNGNRQYCQMGIIMSGICCALAFYNSSLRYEAAYMLYFILALPFLRQPTESAEDKTEQS